MTDEAEKKPRSELPGELGIFYSNADYQEQKTLQV